MQLEQIMVQDAEGRWWGKHRETGEWHYYDGNAWVQDTPPSYQEVTPEPITDKPPIQTSSAPHPKGVEDGETWRRVPPWLLAVGLVAMGALVVIGIYLIVGEESPPKENPSKPAPAPKQEASKPAPGYQPVKHDSGALSVEVPSSWQVDPGEYAKFRGFEGDSGEGESVGPSITASANLGTWHSTGGVPGVFFRASRVLAQRYSNDQLLSADEYDYSDNVGCEPGSRQNFDRPPYSGTMQIWSCEGNNGSNSLWLSLAATPQSRECVLLLQTSLYSEADLEVVQHILDTFEADCEGIT